METSDVACGLENVVPEFNSSMNPKSSIGVVCIWARYIEWATKPLHSSQYLKNASFPGEKNGNMS